MMPRLADIRLTVVDDEILVSLPGTIYSVIYYKLANSPQLLARNLPHKDDGRIELKQAEFLAKERQGSGIGLDPLEGAART
jgi:hypothetical protein